MTSLYQASTGQQLTGAIGILQKGFALVGSMPSSVGLSSSATQAGSFVVLGRFGRKVAEWSNSKFVDGPSAIAVNDQGDHAQVYVANALDGTINCIELAIQDGRSQVESASVIASGFTAGTSNAASDGIEGRLSGLTLDPMNETLCALSTGDHAIYLIDFAGSRVTDRAGKRSHVVQHTAHLSAPTALALARDDDLVVTNNASGGPATLVEFTTSGTFVSSLTLDTNADAAGGVALKATADGFVASVDDATRTLDLRTAPVRERPEAGLMPDPKGRARG